MDPLTLALIFVVISLIIYFISDILSFTKKLPPGPIPFPIIGNSYIVKQYCIKHGGIHKALTELCKLYKTDLLRLKLGGNNFVVVQGDKFVKEALLKDELLGRPKNFFIKLRSMNTGKGITMTDGYLWQEQRVFAMKQLQSLGFGKETMESLMQEEIRKCLNTIQTVGLKLGLKPAISRCIINVLWALVAGFKFDNDEALDELLHLMNSRSKAFDMSGGFMSQFPWIRFIAPEASGYNLISTLNNKLRFIISRTIEEHKATYCKDKTRDYIDAFLHEMYEAKDKDTTFTEDQLIMVCIDFFVAGSETTSSTIVFLLLHMIRSLDIQQTAYDEISGVLKPGEISSLLHREKMPYVRAVLLENERVTPVSPIIGPRRVLDEFSIGGYTIPKNTTILFNLFPSTIDKSNWQEPEIFGPLRFLNKNFKEEKEKLFTFGRGKRRCPGEKLAKGFIFLFFTSFLNHFQLLSKDEKSMPPLKCIPGIVYTPQPYDVTLVPRHVSVPKKITLKYGFT